MERWEIIERNVLLVVGVALLGWIGWLLLYRPSAAGIAGGMALLLCAYWVFWQALYEDKQGSIERPSRDERVMFGIWIWARRLVLGCISGLFAYGALMAVQQAYTVHDFVIILLLLFLSFMAGWVAIFGAGKSMSMADDQLIHKERAMRHRR